MLDGFVADFAAAMRAVDATGPVAQGRSGRVYRPGIGPLPERDLVELTRARMAASHSALYSGLAAQVTYPGSRQKCDLHWSAQPASWAIEVKMIRVRGDNGKLADLSVQDVLSPYESDHSALSDCTKLAQANFDARRAVLIYGFEDQERPLDVLVEAFEALAVHYVRLGPRAVAHVPALIHPVFSRARVFAWEVSA